MWLGPPYMNRKITLLALGAKCGGLGDSGFLNAVTPSAAVACELKNPSLESASIRPSPVKPAPVCQRNSRRVRPQNPPPGKRLDRVFCWLLFMA